jgi:hypothetical protein
VVGLPCRKCECRGGALPYPKVELLAGVHSRAEYDPTARRRGRQEVMHTARDWEGAAVPGAGQPRKYVLHEYDTTVPGLYSPPAGLLG